MVQKKLIDLMLENQVQRLHNKNAIASADCWYYRCKCGYETTSDGLIELHLRNNHQGAASGSCAEETKWYSRIKRNWIYNAESLWTFEILRDCGFLTTSRKRKDKQCLITKPRKEKK